MVDFAPPLCHTVPMFIRESRTTNRKTGVSYTSYKLVEAYRSDQGPRQRVVLSLPELHLPKSEWRKLAIALEARIAGQLSLFEQEPRIAAAAEKAMLHFDFHQLRQKDRQERAAGQEWTFVDLQSVEATEFRSLGPEWVGHTVWERLGLSETLSSAGFTREQQALAEAVVVGRLVAPSSDLATWSWLRHRTALSEWVEGDISRAGKDAVYEIADKLLAHKVHIESALRAREMILFPEGARVFLYDLTNVYMEGAAAGNTLAKYGRSKEKRSDCPLVTLALLVDEHGFPLFSHVYGGNQSEPETLKEVLSRLEEETPDLLQGTVTFVMDRGIATRDNIALLQDKGYACLLVERSPLHKAYEQEFATGRETFERIDNREADADAVYAKKVQTADGGAHVLYLSEGRAQKERAIDRLAEQRFVEDLERVRQSVTKGSIVVPEKVGQRLGRIKERRSVIAQYYDVEIQCNETQKRVTDLTWAKKPAREQRSVLTGCYVIETSSTHADLSAKEIWGLYMTLGRVEDAFRSLKTDLGVRPVYHQTAERTEAHLWISLLAYHLLAVIERQLRESGDTRRWSSVRDVLRTHQRTTVVVTDEQNRVHHIRVSGRPEGVHREIYRKLRMTDPLRREHRIVDRRL